MFEHHDKPEEQVKDVEEIEFYKEESSTPENIDDFAENIEYDMSQLAEYVGLAITTLRCYFNWGVFEKAGVEPKNLRVHDVPTSPSARTHMGSRGTRVYRKFTLDEMKAIKNFLDNAPLGFIAKVKKERNHNMNPVVPSKRRKRKSSRKDKVIRDNNDDLFE